MLLIQDKIYFIFFTLFILIGSNLLNSIDFSGFYFSIKPLLYKNIFYYFVFGKVLLVLSRPRVQRWWLPGRYSSRGDGCRLEVDEGVKQMALNELYELGANEMGAFFFPFIQVKAHSLYITLSIKCLAVHTSYTLLCNDNKMFFRNLII